jgi:hypothetical protein
VNYPETEGRGAGARYSSKPIREDEKMDSEEHKRGSDRLQHPFLAKFRRYADSPSQANPKWDVVTIRNVSPGGLSFNYTQKFEIGTILELDIGLSSVVGTVHCLATVRRVDEMPPKRPDLQTIPVYGIAVQFNDLPDDKKEAIERLIKEHQAAG